MTFSLQMLPVGNSEVPGPELFWMSEWDRWFPLVFQVGLIQGSGVTALVNTGPAQDLEPMNSGWASFLGDRARMKRQDGQFILDQLAAKGIQPSDITHVILTPLQLYSVSNVLAFPNAEICISKRGWMHFNTTHQHPHDNRDTSIPPEILKHLVTDAWDRVRLLDDEDTIVDGIRTWWSGGHHRASIAVEVSTAKGTAVLSDSFFYLDNVYKDHPIGISENIYECLAAHQRARGADIILPLYDPTNFDRFPDGVVA